MQPLPIQVAAHFSSQVIQRRTSLTRVIWYKNEPTTYSTTMTANKINVLVLDIFRINKCSTKKSNFCFQIKTYYIFLRQWVCTVQLLWFNRTSSLSISLSLSISFYLLPLLWIRFQHTKSDPLVTSLSIHNPNCRLFYSLFSFTVNLLDPPTADFFHFRSLLWFQMISPILVKCQFFFTHISSLHMFKLSQLTVLEFHFYKYQGLLLSLFPCKSIRYVN